MATLVCYSDFPDLRPVRLPLSKSIEARRLLIEAVRRESGAACPTVPEPTGPLCEDLQNLRRALADYRLRRPELHVGSSGTALRFLTALCAATPGYEVAILGSEQLTRRPMAPLIRALRSLGAEIQDQNGYAPLQVSGRRLQADRLLWQPLLSSESSQFISALLLASPLFAGRLPELPSTAGMASAPYVQLTCRMLSSGLAEAEYDWSAASYFYLAALLSGTPVSISTPLKSPARSLQGDAECARLFAMLGINTLFHSHSTILMSGGEISLPAEINMASRPDLVPALAVAAAFSALPLRITGISHLAFKESNRLQTVVQALRALGCQATAFSDAIRVSGQRIVPSGVPEIDCHADHRIAMSVAPAAALLPQGLLLQGAECVAKSFPDFPAQLQRVGYLFYETK